MPQPHESGSGSLTRLKGIMLCRRCDACGTRIDLKREAEDRVIMQCPRCQREYIFVERSSD